MVDGDNAEDYGKIDDRQGQDVSAVDGDAGHSANAARRCGERFHGKNG